MVKKRELKPIKPKSLVDGFSEVEGKRKTDKEQRTLFLKREQFERFQKICKDEGKVVAHVIDEWIENFLDQYR